MEDEICLDVSGMMCQNNCGATVRNALQSVPNVNRAIVDFPTQKARIFGNNLNITDLIEAVESVGFDAVESVISTNQNHYLLKVQGMMCQKNCGSTVKNALSNVFGVTSAVVSFEDSSAIVYGTASLLELIDAVESVGFDCSLIEPSDENKRASNEVKKERKSKSASLDEIIIKVTEYPPGSLKSTFSIQGMSCAACVSKIEKSLLKSNIGALHVSVILLMEKAEVIHSGDIHQSTKEIEDFITNLGYPAKLLSSGDYSSTKKTSLMTVNVTIDDMRSETCVNDIERIVRNINGVKEVHVNLLKCNGVIILDSKVVGPRDVIKEINSMGYTCAYFKETRNGNDSQKSRDNEILVLRKLFWFSFTLAFPVFLIHMFLNNFQSIRMALMTEVLQNTSIEEILFLILVTPVHFVCGYRFHHKALVSLKQGSMGMDFLVSFGTNCAYFYSLFSLIYGLVHVNYHGHTFFEASGVLITFVIMGKYMEAIAKGKTGEALTKLVSLAPVAATLLYKENKSDDVYKEMVIDVDLIQINDLLRIVPGGQIPADGEIYSGSTFVDESMITGESMPVSKVSGDPVYGGTINQNGSIIMLSTRVGNDTTLARIIKLVENAQSSKAPIQNFADRVAGVFAPVVVTISIFTFLIWFILGMTSSIPAAWIEMQAGGDVFLFALKFAISTVVVACPCALGLATPTAIMVGTGVGAQLGILIKGGAALEKAHKVTCVLFDKTGTLTEGKPTVQKVINVGTLFHDEELLKTAASAERGSEHPLAMAVVKRAEKENLALYECQEFDNTPGKGLSCKVKGLSILIGSKRWMSHNGIVLPEMVLKVSKDLEKNAFTLVFLAANGNVEGIFAITDTIKSDVSLTIIALNAKGIKTWMITGDNENTANAVAREVGIFNIMADVLPSEKSEKVKELQDSGEVVAFVGDGVNDSVALASADVGIAIGSGADIAVETADMVLVSSNISDVYTALELSRIVFNRIRYNFIWAMGYNILALPVASGLLFPFFQIGMPPQLAGLLMAFSSVSVVTSSLALKMYKRPVLSLISLRIRQAQPNSPFSTIYQIISSFFSIFTSNYQYTRVINETDNESNLEMTSLLDETRIKVVRNITTPTLRTNPSSNSIKSVENLTFSSL